jgi:hypothetical protein
MGEVATAFSFWIKFFVLTCILFWSVLGMITKCALFAKAES